MSLNKDGLNPGQIVDYETMLRVEAERKRKQAEAKAKPEKRPVSNRNEKDK